MSHNKARIESYRYTLKGMGLSQSSIDFCVSWSERYAELQAKRISELEDALADFHDYQDHPVFDEHPLLVKTRPTAKPETTE